jgi:hypothetical protein
VPYTLFPEVRGFVPLPPRFLAVAAGIVARHIAGAEPAKKQFYARGDSRCEAFTQYSQLPF